MSRDRRRVIVALLVAAVCAAATAATAGERRQLGAHEHGRSTLDIAIEGTRVAMELRTPGMDIVGFEHPAETDEQKAALARAEAALADPLALFVLPPGAGCRLREARVELEAQSNPLLGPKALAGAEELGPAFLAAFGGHSEFHAEHALDCVTPSALASITFAAFFDRFPGAQKITVTLLTERGQAVFEAERDAPRVSLGGVM